MNLFLGIVLGIIVGGSAVALILQNGIETRVIKERKEAREMEAKSWEKFWHFHQCGAIKRNGERCGFALTDGFCNVHAVKPESGDPTDVAPR